ncbi:Tetratricopeptide repeat-containing protein [Chitinophaga sp. CF118]|uniref:tetratricopeptide repeat protein n=1 Tax=Chitinophaga sp. CF118 TaxID=1884367 RepID=UPI0008DEC938|nr:tetratricopeptide repeat protein [Chitinophaga sp. CF118]SFE28112.1 Tetratricopeptide repeat-containing protein [Chitinophaga sp. CF118]
MNMRDSLLKTMLFVGLLFSSAIASAQDSKELYNTATSFIRDGDYANAILVLNQALQMEPDNVEFRKQLGFAYYLQGDMSKSKNIIESLLNKKEADAQLYQIAGNIYQARQEWKTAQKLYEKGLKKFPESGELYNDNGQLLMFLKIYEGGMGSWLKGIEKDPNFPSNYYNAARAYAYTKDVLWIIIYGEIFVNLESYTDRTAEVRNMLIDAYKKLYNDPSILSKAVEEQQQQATKKSKRPSAAEFENNYLAAMGKQVGVVMTGIDPESLTMLRTRFLLDWYNFSGLRFPYALFDFQRTLLREGMFEAYNQWIFGPVANQAAFKAWTSLHKSDYDGFLQFQRSHTLKMRPDEHYNDNHFSLPR